MMPASLVGLYCASYCLNVFMVYVYDTRLSPTRVYSLETTRVFFVKIFIPRGLKYPTRCEGCAYASTESSFADVNTLTKLFTL